MAETAQPLRLLMLSHFFAERGGGIESVAAALAGGLASRGFETVWLASGSAEDGPNSAYRGVPLAASDVAERLLGIPYPVLRPSAWRTIFREAARADVILVHDALYQTSTVAYLAARAHRKPLVVVQHVGFVPYRSALLRALMRAANHCIGAPLLRRADRVIFISELTLRQFGHIRWRRPPAVIFNGVDTGAFSPPATTADIVSARQSLGLPSEGPVALFVGRFVEKKGLRILQRMAHLRSDIVFAFAGNGMLDPRGWGLPNTRVFGGLSGAALAQLYRASNLLLLPSTGEGFPLVIQEALACGLPIICGTDTACADPRAEPLLTAVEVDTANADQTAQAFAEEMTRLLAHQPSAAERMERFAFARASYSRVANAAAYAAMLRGLCSAGRLDGNPSGVVGPAEEE